MSQNTHKRSYDSMKNGKKAKKEPKENISFDNEEEEIAELNRRIQEEAPQSGSQPRSDGQLRFDSLPLSRRTLAGLNAAKLQIATEIQAAAIPHALAGRDILGAAKTGSGKTLAFVIPMLERLFRERWSTEDGLAAIVISPTRELAFQIFEVIRTVGKKHLLSAGLITGGKKEFAGEQERIIRMNILVATPGRLLQHFEQTSGFDASQLLVLILDEADRILDLGFKSQVDAIINYLPTYRQTFLFSATQTKSIKDLARLSLNRPEYLAVHAGDEETTPKQLIQYFIQVPLDKKLDVLFSFIKSHIKSKMIIFFSTCAQVRYVYECFRSMQPGTVLMALHGKIKQEKRLIIFNDYLKRNAACMLATDIAARGLDFPNVDWVIQVDSPEDTAMYIHRVGRTARYNKDGKALLFLMPHEEELMLTELKNSNIPIKKLTVNPNRTFSVSSSAAALLAAHSDYRNYAKKAFSGYLRSLQLQPLHPIPDIKSLPLDEFAQALGLPMTPEIPIILKESSGKDVDEARNEIRKKKNVNRALDKLKKQIKEAKEAKKRKREEKVQAALAAGEDASDISDSSDDDSTMTDGTSSNDEQDEKNGKNKNQFSVLQMRAEIEKKREEMKKQKELEKKKKRKNKTKNDDGNDEEDSDEDFLEVKKVHKWNEGEVEENNHDDDGEDSHDENKPSKTSMDIIQEEEEQAAGKSTLPKNMKISKDGKLKNISGNNKLVFDEEGNIYDNKMKLNALPQQHDDNKQEVVKRIEKRTKELKILLDAAREEDELRDKERIREKKLQKKQQLKQPKNGDDQVIVEDGMFATLDNPQPESEEENDEEDDENDSDDNNSSDDDDEDDNNDESEDEDDEDEDDDAHARKKRKQIEDQEALALQLLTGGRKK